MNKTPKISVVIATKNRPNKLRSCLRSILDNDFDRFEIIVVDQSNFTNSLNSLNKKKIRYYNQNRSGKSIALNFGVNKASGDIIAFTDDDCIVAKDWLQNIYESLSKNNIVVGAFGNVFPYKPGIHRGKICPSTFKKPNSIIKRPGKHWLKIGFGNNMAFKKEVFDEGYRFREWLGPGSIGKAAVDAEFVLRLLVENRGKYFIYHNSGMKVFHDRWLSRKESRDAELAYDLGELACYGYFYFSGERFAKSIVSNKLKKEINNLFKTICTLIDNFNHETLYAFKYSFIEVCFVLKGLAVAFFFVNKNRISKIV